MKRSMFSLIELIIVIAIIGSLTLLILPQMQNSEKDAEEGVAAFNSKAVGHFMSNFKAANGAFPSGLHLGTKEVEIGAGNSAGGKDKLLDNMAPVLTKQFDNNRASVTGVRHTCLSSVGIAEVTAGLNGDKKIKTTDASLTMNNPSNPGNLIQAIKVTDDWTLNGSTTGEIVRFNGMGMKQLLDEAPWVGANLSQAVDHKEQVIIYAFLLGPTTNTQAVYRSNGTFWKNSRSSMQFKLSPKAQYFNYPIVFFRLSKSSANFLGALTISDDGMTFVQ